MINCPPAAAKRDCQGCPKKKECKEEMRQYQELQRKIKAGLPKSRPWIITEEPIPNLKSELKEEDKPPCFGCYGYRVCVNRTTLPSKCPWEQRCYNSQRDS